MDHAHAARRITRTLFAAQSLASAATVAIVPVFTIIGAQLSGHPSWAGVPSMVYLLGQAFSAFAWGQLMDRLGRRGTLVLGLVLGATGGLIAFAAVQSQSFAAFLLGSILVGIAVSAVALARFVAAEVHPQAERARAISTVVLGGTVGAIMGPLFAGPSARLARNWGFNELSGPYLATIAFLLAAALLVFLLLRPEPRDLSRLVAAAHDPTPAGPTAARSILQIFGEPPAFVALAAMVFGQLIMAMLMVITPLHMRGHQHQISSISFVISVHVAGMYAFSILSGRLADRWGRGPVILSGAGVLILASLSARLSPDVLPLSAALFLLGLGWNFCYVGGSTLLADQLSLVERARTQGFNDLLIGLTSAAGSLSSGVVFATIGYGAMALVAGTTALIPLLLAVWWQAKMRAVPVIP